MTEQNIIKLQDIVKDWDNFRLEAQDNMFYQFEHGRMDAVKESTETYKKAIDIHTKLHCYCIYMRLKYGNPVYKY